MASGVQGRPVQALWRRDAIAGRTTTQDVFGQTFTSNGDPRCLALTVTCQTSMAGSMNSVCHLSQADRQLTHVHLTASGHAASAPPCPTPSATARCSSGPCSCRRGLPRPAPEGHLKKPKRKKVTQVAADPGQDVRVQVLLKVQGKGQLLTQRSYRSCN